MTRMGRLDRQLINGITVQTFSRQNPDQNVFVDSDDSGDGTTYKYDQWYNPD